MKYTYIYKASLITTFLFALLFSSCDEENPYQVDYSEVPDPFSITGIEPDTTESGLIFYIVEEGSGNFETGKRDQIRFYYTVRVKDDPDRIITSSYANGRQTPVSSPITNPTVNSLLLEGFKEGVLGMKEGEKRVLILPPDLAYGVNSNSTYSDKTIWIDMELAEILF